MNKDKIIKELVEFVEGRMDFNTFWQNYKTNKDYYELFDIKLGNIYSYLRNSTLNHHLNIYNPNTRLGKDIICNDICHFLEYNNISFNKTDMYEKSFMFALSVQPNYVYIEDEDFLNKIIEQAPEGLKKGEKKKWIKNHIKEMFKYDVKPPKWIQDPEWPIVNGKPLVFKEQTKERKDDERVFYTFYDPDTLEEKVIVQFY